MQMPVSVILIYHFPPLNILSETTLTSVACIFVLCVQDAMKYKVISDFEKGIIIKYHRNGQSVRDISSELNYPKTTVAM